MNWISFLHLYQPANIDIAIVKEATLMSYERILRALEENSSYKVTMNISGCLLDRWVDELGRNDLIDRLKKLIKSGKIELVGSAAYHCLLPLVSEKEAIKQIKEQEVILKKYFGRDLRLAGFFFPEMAYGQGMAKIIKKLGYEWIIIDQVGLGPLVNEAPVDVFIDSSSGLKVVVRSRDISESYIPVTLGKMIGLMPDAVCITACDAELFGLRHLDQTSEYEKFLSNASLKTMCISEYINNQKKHKKQIFRDCSWQSTDRELAGNILFSLWSDPKNKIHQDLWQLATLAQEIEQNKPVGENFNWCRWHLVRGLASCAWWWSSSYDFRGVFGPVAWSPDEIERGINDLIRSIRASESLTSIATKLLAEDLALNIRKKIWHQHWTKHYAGK
ncbi:MAG: hypothetical protein WCG01_00405 [bacterium]